MSCLTVVNVIFERLPRWLMISERLDSERSAIYKSVLTFLRRARERMCRNHTLAVYAEAMMGKD